MLAKDSPVIFEAKPDKLKFHPVVYLFPELREDEFVSLVESIRLNGQLEPVWITSDGQVFDGRHRLKATLILGRNVLCRELDASDEQALIAHVVAQNLTRRHMRKDQRAMVAAAIMDREQNDSPWRTYGDLCDAFDITNNKVKLAKSVRNRAEPEIITAVEDGRIDINTALETIHAERGLTRDESVEALKSKDPGKYIREKAHSKRPKQSYVSIPWEFECRCAVANIESLGRMDSSKIQLFPMRSSEQIALMAFGERTIFYVKMMMARLKEIQELEIQEDIE